MGRFSLQVNELKVVSPITFTKENIECVYLPDVTFGKRREWIDYMEFAWRVILIFALCVKDCELHWKLFIFKSDILPSHTSSD
ncbi:Pre-Mrna-Processing Factor 39 [Manis pentadactyla]|nr:Pre-Mrna-Processing Factor 39 [Manis pentadactyla]